MKLYENEYWEVIFVDWCQEFPGDCIISSKLEKTSLSNLSAEEWQSLGKIEKELERTMQKLFQATMFNFACLMNNAYRDNETPHVHFHFIPRYQGKRYILTKEYSDQHFGYNMWKWALSDDAQKDLFTKQEKQELFKMIKKEFRKENI